MNVYNNTTIVMFGGFQDIAHERDDLMAFDTVTKEWQVMELESIAGKSIEKKSSVIDPSPSPSPTRSRMGTIVKTTMMINRRFRSENRGQPVERNKSNETHSNWNSSLIMQQQGEEEALSPSMQQKRARKMKDFLIKKRLLLDRFEVFDPKMIMQLKRPSPTTQTMKRTLDAIATPVGVGANGRRTEIDFFPKRGSLITPRLGETIKQLPIVRDGRIAGRRAGARDGHSAHIIKNNLLIFGGDRHKLSYNDVFIFDLEKYFNS